MKNLIILMVTFVLVVCSNNVFAYVWSANNTSERARITRVTSLDNGLQVIFLPGIPNQGCTYSDRGVIDPRMPGAKEALVNLRLAITSGFDVRLVVLGCFCFTESDYSPGYVHSETAPHIMHVEIFPK